MARVWRGLGPDSGFGFGFFLEFGFGSVSALPGSDSDRFRRARFGFGSVPPGQVRIRIGSASAGSDSDRIPVRFGFCIRTRGLNSLPYSTSTITASLVGRTACQWSMTSDGVMGSMYRSRWQNCMSASRINTFTRNVSTGEDFHLMHKTGALVTSEEVAASIKAHDDDQATLVNGTPLYLWQHNDCPGH